MIGKPEWFTYRIFGWGIAPKTWQGWLYVLVSVLIIMLATYLPLSQMMKIIVVSIIAVIFLVDVIHIMIKLPKVHDERQNAHQLIIERNSSFAAITAIVIIALYQAYLHPELVKSGALPFDWSLLVVLGAMLAMKIGTTLYLYKRM